MIFAPRRRAHAIDVPASEDDKPPSASPSKSGVCLRRLKLPAVQRTGFARPSVSRQTMAVTCGAVLSALCVKPASRKFSLTPGLLAHSLPLPPSVVLVSALDAAAADEPCASSSSDSPRAVSASRGNVSAGRQANVQTSNQASLIRKSAPPVPLPRFLCDAE